MEYWKDIRGYENIYEISSIGRVKTKPKNRSRKLKGKSDIIPEKIHRPNYDTRGYNVAKLYLKGGVKMFKVHRLVYQAFKGVLIDGLVIDHIDNDQNNNNKNNLQQISQRENSNKNPCKPVSEMTSKYRGVAFCKQTGKWRSIISVKRKNIWLGRFNSEKEASFAYESKLLEIEA